jgi:hypothetical protein
MVLLVYRNAITSWKSILHRWICCNWLFFLSSSHHIRRRNFATTISTTILGLCNENIHRIPIYLFTQGYYCSCCKQQQLQERNDVEGEDGVVGQHHSQRTEIEGMIRKVIHLIFQLEFHWKLEEKKSCCYHLAGSLWSFLCFLFYLFHAPPSNNSNTIAIVFSAIMGTFKYCTACKNPIICDFNGLSVVEVCISTKSKPYLARNLGRFKINTEFMNNKVAFVLLKKKERKEIFFTKM